MKTTPSTWNIFNLNNLPKNTATDTTIMRPNTLNVSRDKHNNDTRKFIREVLYAWRAKARCNVVPAERLHDLFKELNFHPTEKQINEMLQTAKFFARRGSSVDAGSKLMNGLTFGEFCVLAADLKRFRTQSLTRNHDDNNKCINSQPNSSSSSSTTTTTLDTAKTTTTTTTSTSSIPPKLNISSKNMPADVVNNAEVFLGGSCNPTTWRADVAIPTLNKLGISFYNPQVSDWTPDLIELEHRAKEKARVLFFVMDSETRASAGAIEAAHIAGQNSRHLVLVLHPYKSCQSILNEPLSAQEFMDLKRNQELLKELIKRRGLPVLDSIPSGLQRTKDILADGYVGNAPPSNIASRLISVRQAFNRVTDKSIHNSITIAQCHYALTFLGYPQNLISSENLRNIVESHRKTESEMTETAEEKSASSSNGPQQQECNRFKSPKVGRNSEISINYDEFCMLTSYLAMFQQEMHESGCISPIKGTNVPPPPIFLTNTPEWNHHHQNDNLAMTNNYSNKQIFRTSSCKSVPEDRFVNGCGGSNSDLYNRNRDSGTSSPQPHEQQPAQQQPQHKPLFILTNTNSNTKINHIDKKSKISLNVEYFQSEQEDESDSNDSVFSSGSSSDSNLCVEQNLSVKPKLSRAIGETSTTNGFEIRDLYLGGSCMLRTTWRKDVVIPMLKQKGITYHLPMLHESICGSPDELPEPRCNGTDKDNSSGKEPIALTQQPSTMSSSQSDDLLTKKRLNISTNFLENRVNDTTTPKTEISNNHDSVANCSSKNNSKPSDKSSSNNSNNSQTAGSNTLKTMFNPAILDASRILLFVITNETRSLAPMTLAAHYIGLGYNVVLCVQMLPEFCVIGNDRLTPAAIKDYNRGRSYLIDLAKRQGVPVFNDLKQTMECAIEKVKTCNSRNSI